MKELRGVITAMTTPFGPEGNVDVCALRQQVEFLVSKGVDCLYPCGTTGEMYLMSEQERKIVAETVVDAARGRTTVYIHCGAMRIEEVVALSKHALRIGADGIGIITPSYYRIDDDAIVDYYVSISKQLPMGFPIYVYAIPQLANNDISYECMQKIADRCPNVVGIKYSYPDMKRLMEFMNVRGGNFSVVFGADDLFYPALHVGCVGTVSGCSSCIPEPFIRVYQYFREGQFEKALDEHRKCSRIVRILRAGANLSIFKRVQDMRGLSGGHVRSPLPEITPEEFRVIENELAAHLGEDVFK